MKKSTNPILVLCILALLAVLISGNQVQAQDEVRLAGDVLRCALPAAGVVLSAGHRDSQGFWQLTEAVAITFGTTVILKCIVPEKRPDGGVHSFPSGHTSISFCSAEFIRKRYGWGWGIPAYGAAVFVGYSRVQSKKHWAHDVAAGALIGFGFGTVFATPYHGWLIQPQTDGTAWGVTICRIF
jgi:membrane-associated phospholipid phosphatase